VVTHPPATTPEADQAFGQAVLPHLDAAYNLARWLVRDPAAAEDVVQDAVVRALQYFASFRGGNARAWLLQIVRHTAYSFMNARRQSPAADDAAAGLDVPDPGATPEVTLAAHEDMAQLHQALDTLPLELRECIVLREFEELSYKEIARITEVPVGTVMSRLWRARQALMRVPAPVVAK
jgi:RNA polymerase sigma-70 factor (ECF subfamily)